MRCGDTVKHKPTGETWTVSYVDGDNLAWVGWPNGYAKVSDCAIIKSCSDLEHVLLLKRITESRDEGSDQRARRAMQDLHMIASQIENLPTHKDHLVKIVNECVDAFHERNRCQGLLNDATMRLQNLETTKRHALFELIDRAYPSNALETA